MHAIADIFGALESLNHVDSINANVYYYLVGRFLVIGYMQQKS